MKKLGIIFFSASCLLLGSCYYDTQEALYGIAQNAPCDTTNITYTGKIAPIIAANCSACHSAITSASGNGIILDNISGLQEQVKAGKLMGDINQLPGFNAMPQSGSRIDACSIAKIQHWVDLGAQ